MITARRRQRWAAWAFAVTVLVIGSHAIAAGTTTNRLDGTVPTPGTLEQYLRDAALSNAGLEAAFARWKAAVERIPQAAAMPDLRFTYTYFITEVETRVGPQRQKIGFQQMFPWFGKRRLRGDMAAEAAAAAQADYEKAKLTLFYRVKVAYCDYWYLAQALAVTRQHRELVGSLEGVARTRFAAGAAPNLAVIQAQVELGKLDDRLRALEAMRAPLMARLNAAVNRPIHDTLPWPEALPADVVSFTDEDVEHRLKDGSPELRRLTHLQRQSETGVKLARKDVFPDIGLGLDYVQTDDARMPNTPDSGKDPLMATVSLNLPIWQGKYRAAEREARLRLDAVASEREDAAERLQAELKLVLYHYREAERKIGLYADTLIPKAEQSLNVARQSFEAGKTSFISLIDAERMYLEFALDYRNARAERTKRLAEIEMLTGTPKPRQEGEDR